MQSFKSLGMLETKKTIHIQRWTSFVQECLALRYRNDIDLGKDPLSIISNLIPTNHIEALYQALEWLSLVPPVIASASPIPMPALPDAPMAPIEIFAYLLAHKMRYKPQECDMVVLSHEVITRPKQTEGERQAQQEDDVQVHKSSLITYGTPRASAMARTVGIPVAIAALRVLDEKVDIRGVARPDDPNVYDPVLRGLQEVGLGMKEHVGKAANTVEAKLIASWIGS